MTSSLEQQQQLILTTNKLSVLPIKGFIKNYHWGSLDDKNYISKFKRAADTLESGTGLKDAPEDRKPLAELWFGSHPSGVSTLLIQGQHVKLDSFLSKSPEMVGNIDQYFKHDKKLPFLFKILAVAQPLSLQAHPDKKLAEVLHMKNGQHYPDSNDKPELAIALTEFEVLCDFRPSEEICQFFKNLAPLQKLVGQHNSDLYLKTCQSDASTENQQQTALSACFKALLACDKDTITRETKNIILNLENASKLDKELLKLIAKLDSIYPGDAGVLTPFFLNYIKLQPGQAVYLKPNKLHAYLKGECVECMKCSDNVVRAGLTSKHKDVDTLINMLDYRTVKKVDEILLPGTRSTRDPAVVSYVPTDDFKVDKILITQKNAPIGEYKVSALPSASILLFFSGKGHAKDFCNPNLEHKIAVGSAAFVPPTIELKLTSIQCPMTIYRSYF